MDPDGCHMSAEGNGAHAESGKPKARLVITGYHDRLVGTEVRTKAPVASRRGRNLFSWPQLTTSSPLRKETSRMRYFMETFDDVPPGELAAEPVPGLRKAPVTCETTKLRTDGHTSHPRHTTAGLAQLPT